MRLAQADKIAAATILQKREEEVESVVEEAEKIAKKVEPKPAQKVVKKTKKG